MAQLQGFLLRYKTDPLAAVENMVPVSSCTGTPAWWCTDFFELTSSN